MEWLRFGTPRPNPSAPVFAQPCELRVGFPGGASGKEPTMDKGAWWATVHRV